MVKVAALSKAFNPESRDRMSKKLVETVQHLDKLMLDKKASADGFNEEIKSAKKRMNTLAEAMEKGDMTLLNGVFYDDEIASFVSGRAG